MIPPKVKEVVATNDYSLIVTFDNAVIKQYNMQNMIEQPRFLSLKNKALFMTVSVDMGGYGVSWDSEIDLSENELWTQGIEV
ncbi:MULTISPECIES: DUF2442 domain-containing protein [Desulfosporosinus]|uniref:DUF2442 domain-containing protein n=2 Tax=Desulfosporosinus TaxID=79206 RepID=A0A1M5VLN4_9FIRM|nr:MULTISPECIES: DUF2442 domain-containing protein [Desulfosporosinus]MDA8228520.1 DUF2442 domain-containing protein [Desulfitobacterium hafniense]MDO0824946.1 DUF2442 domain-containing protein [Desulfosporosinus nitroreducens]SHH76088.1 Protein of unknown function [Desulfosporosinus lacus DSM 15449]